MAAEKVLLAAAALAIVTMSNRWITFLSHDLSRNRFLVCFFIAILQSEILTDSISSARHYSSALRSLGLSVFVSESITTYTTHKYPVARQMLPVLHVRRIMLRTAL